MLMRRPARRSRCGRRAIALALPAVEEILPGIQHWTALHPRIHLQVHSYYIEPSATLIDPMLPAEGLAAFDALAEPHEILLTNRHHYRDSARFVEAFGCRVRCHELGLHRFADGPPVEGFAFGERVAPDITALEVGVLCPEETVLQIVLGDGALAFADSVIRRDDGQLGFVSDQLLGDDPEAIRAGLRQSFRRLLDQRFDSLLLAHGEPLIGGGKRALEELASG